MSDLKSIADLPESQQKALFSILGVNRSAFRTSDIHKKLSDQMTGRSVGAVLGALYRNGYLKKISGGRDKTWALSEKAIQQRDQLHEKLADIKSYWQ